MCQRHSNLTCLRPNLRLSLSPNVTERQDKADSFFSFTSLSHTGFLSRPRAAMSRLLCHYASSLFLQLTPSHYSGNFQVQVEGSWYEFTVSQPCRHSRVYCVAPWLTCPHETVSITGTKRVSVFVVVQHLPLQLSL